MARGYDSPSSPPLPISTGAGNHKYIFPCSPSPPFSPPPSSHASSENLHPLLQKLASPQRVPSAFSLDRPGPDALDSRSSCLEDLLEWFAQRCCSFCSRFVQSHLHTPATYSSPPLVAPKT